MGNDVYNLKQHGKMTHFVTVKHGVLLPTANPVVSLAEVRPDVWRYLNWLWVIAMDGKIRY